MSDRRLVLVTAITPLLWGTTYIVTSELLPPGRPLFAAAARALPAAVLLLAALVPLAGRRVVPDRAWALRAAVLGTLNIGIFFALLFVAAYRLPGAIAAVPGTLGPFVVAGLAVPLLGERPTRRTLLAAALGVAGVVLLVGASTVRLDPLGVAAALGGTVAMSLGGVLGRRWGVPDGFASRTVALVALTGWQLLAGGLLLAPLALAVEGPPPALDGRAVLGLSYLALLGTALAYALWFRGVTRLPAIVPALLSRLSPVVAATAGWVVLGQALSGLQLAGAAIVVLGVAVGIGPGAPQVRPAAPAEAPSPAT